MRLVVRRLILVAVLALAAGACDTSTAPATTAPVTAAVATARPTASPRPSPSATPRPSPTPAPTPQPEWMAGALGSREVQKVKVEDLRYEIAVTDARLTDLCVGGALQPTEGQKILLVDMHLEVISDDGPVFSPYSPDPEDFTLVNERGVTWAWDRSACGLPAFIPMLGLLEETDFSVTFTIPEDAGRLWLRYQPHDTEIDTSWGLGVPS